MNWKLALPSLALLFILGLLTGFFFNQPTIAGAQAAEITQEEPVIEQNPTEDKIPEGYGIERHSPADRIKENQILVYSDEIVIDLENAVWATFTDTNSMDPVLDKGANAIQVVPKSPSEIKVGDIVSYDSRIGPVIHRVVHISYDEEGWFAIMKGDNNPDPDPDKVRFEQVRRVVVAIIY